MRNGRGLKDDSNKEFQFQKGQCKPKISCHGDRSNQREDSSMHSFRWSDGKEPKC